MEFTNREIEKIFLQFQEVEETLSPSDIKKVYLSKEGPIQSLFKTIGSLSTEEKKSFGKEINMLKNYVEEVLSRKKISGETEELGEDLDVTAPFDINTPSDKRPRLKGMGTTHPLMQEMKKVLDIFTSMGFDIVESRQLDDDYHMFEAINIPKGHPARDIWDTFWTDEGLIPPAHTSTMQNRVMKKFKNPPIRAVIPGRCFRNEATDASHEHTFYQIEGVYIDKGISLGDMLGTIKTYLEAFFETELEVKVQPAFFPFTEPDCEFVISCPFCKKTGCHVCGYDGWMEIMGCGMIHPSVLEEGGIDSQAYTGFAWGFGLDRLVMIKHGIQDIRRLHSGDLTFLKQF